MSPSEAGREFFGCGSAQRHSMRCGDEQVGDALGCERIASLIDGAVAKENEECAKVADAGAERERKATARLRIYAVAKSIRDRGAGR